MVTKEEIIETLKICLDPEIQIDVWTLGLIYEIDILPESKNKKSDVKITMTFTSPMCPYGPMLMDDIYHKVSSIDGVGKVEVILTFEPVWKPSDELRAMLGL